MIKISDQNEMELFKVKLQQCNRNRINQGDIVKDIEYVEYIKREEGILSISLINFPYVIVLSQDCDLQHDYTYRIINSNKKDKLLISALVAPLYNADQVLNGEHLSELYKPITNPTQRIDKFSKGKKLTTKYQSLIENEIPRYYYMKFPNNIDIYAEAIIDFKHYFSVNIEYLENEKKNDFVCQISELYREKISQRFVNYLSRIGLPNLNESDPSSGLQD